eukprot:TRINITY_DN8056_c0_g1_i1.p1 TRINITY_DN8056_c0_g1~~TRINITY_DN8056_c0_g1_i1.p1  ORF type:complete len:289 (-),score=22.57 TRINITY_DN8056_c0_g1_i1:106-972(-)
MTAKFAQVRTTILDRIQHQKSLGVYKEEETLIPSARSRPTTPLHTLLTGGRSRSAVTTNGESSPSSTRPSSPTLISSGRPSGPSLASSIRVLPSTYSPYSNKETDFSDYSRPFIDLHYPPSLRHLMTTCTQITPTLYISSYTPALQIKYLMCELRITHIVNLTPHPNPWPDHFEYLHIPTLQDINSQDIVQYLPKVLDFIRDALLHKGKVLIFSERGVSRCAAFAIGYLMDSYSYTFHEAFLHVHERRYIVELNKGFMNQLCKWGMRRTDRSISSMSVSRPNTSIAKF